MCEAWSQNVIFRDTSQKHCMEQWNGSSGLPGICWMWKEGRWGEGGNGPSWERGQMFQYHLCVLLFAAASTRELVGIQYYWFLKCAFSQHYLFLKLLWQGFISSCVWLSPRGRYAEARLGSWHSLANQKKSFVASRSPFPLSFLGQKVCAVCSGTTTVDLEVPFSQKDDAQCCFFGAAVAVCTNKNWGQFKVLLSVLANVAGAWPVVSALISWGQWILVYWVPTWLINTLKYYFKDFYYVWCQFLSIWYFIAICAPKSRSSKAHQLTDSQEFTLCI